MLAFGAVCEGPDQVNFTAAVQPALETLFNLLSDPHGKVREMSTWVFSKICECHAHLIVSNETTMNAFIQRFIGLLQDKPKIANQACHLIMNLATSLESPGMDTNKLTPYFDHIFQGLVGISTRPDAPSNMDLVLTAFGGLSILTEKSAPASDPAIFNSLQ